MGKRVYLLAAAALFATLVLIALFVRDSIVRPYGGDFLVMSTHPPSTAADRVVIRLLG